MKVIKSGRAIVWGPTQITCWCGAILEIEKDDLITWHTICGREEEPCDQVGIKCPECHQKVPVSGIPWELKKRIMN